MKKRVYYEVFANCVYGSDVLEFDEFKDALQEAKKWQKECDNEIIILKKSEEEVRWQ